MHPVTTRLAQRLLGTPLIRNSIRGELVEEMVVVALEPEWQLCGGDWGPCDLKQADGPLRIQVKASIGQPHCPAPSELPDYRHFGATLRK